MARKARSGITKRDKKVCDNQFYDGKKRSRNYLVHMMKCLRARKRR